MTLPTDLVFDLDGVVWVGNHELGGAGEVLNAAARTGINVLFVTNNASRTRAELVDKIDRITGYRATPAQVVNSAMAGASLLPDGEAAVLVVAGAGVVEAVTDRGGRVTDDWQAADAVIAGFSRTVDYPLLRDATLAIRAGALFIATNTDATFPAPNGQWPGAGATIAFLREATGVEPLVGGKPHPPMRALVEARLTGDRVVMVGDRPETDLALARAAGWTAVMTLSGVTDDADVVPPVWRPDHVIADVSGLPGLLGFSI